MRDLTASLARLILVRLRRDERGVIAALVAVLIGSGVLLGMGALVIDVGQLYQERAELQNGADAAALGVAKSCALGACTNDVANQLADGNASSLTGGTEGVTLICGSGSLGSCPAGPGSLTSCPSQPPAGTNFADVYTATRTASGSTLLPPVFATTLMGSAYQGTTVRACAQAEWGAPSTATAVGLAISACEWDQDTQRGTLFAPAPPYSQNPLPSASFDQQLMLNPGNGAGCATEPAGADGSGNFGWAQAAPGTCTLAITGPTFPESTAAVTAACQTTLQNAQQNQTAILVPVYVSLNSAVNTYALKGFADFVVTGYDFGPGLSEPDWLDPANTCTGTNDCVTGYFVQGVIPSTGSFAGPSLGAYLIDLTG
ncbi:MAG TPA: TadE/TadG family type IV pilus assembly protein [Streptosporangiaceae bacterium]|nr:TadE/TadG family type IV pilus assembly protein [Streptosporangiaceae bacterium]